MLTYEETFAMKYNNPFHLLSLGGLMIISLSMNAAEKNDKEGYVSGSFESTSVYYNEDIKTAAAVPDGMFGSNNYIKLDYYSGRFSAGVQMEGAEF